MTRLAIFGASGHGKVVGDAAHSSGWTEFVFYDDRWPELVAVGPWPVVGTIRELLAADRAFDAAVVAVGDNAQRLTLQQRIVAAGIPVARIVHRAATVSQHAHVGDGSVVFAGAVVNPFAYVGDAVIVNTGATIDHDCEICDGVHVSPGAHLGGAVRVGPGCWIGIGASVRHSITIGARVVVGAGAAVVADVEDGLTVAGVPARPLTTSSTE